MPERQREQFSFDGVSTVFLNRPYFRRGMKGCVPRRYSMLTHYCGISIHFFLNHGISVTLRGTRSVEPFRPSVDFEDLTVCLALETAVFFALEAFCDTFFAADLVLDAAFFAAAVVFLAVDLVAVLALDAAFLEADVVFAAAFLAAAVDFLAVDLVAVLALVAAFLADFEALSAVFAAAPIFFATAALRPASWSFLEPADAILDTVSILALINFFAVAAPIPGSAVNASIFELPFEAIGPPTTPYRCITSILLSTHFQEGLN